MHDLFVFLHDGKPACTFRRGDYLCYAVVTSAKAPSHLGVIV